MPNDAQPLVDFPSHPFGRHGDFAQRSLFQDIVTDVDSLVLSCCLPVNGYLDTTLGFCLVACEFTR